MEDCEHKYSEVSRKKVILNYQKAGIFTDGFIEYGEKILQKCDKCQKLETIIY